MKEPQGRRLPPRHSEGWDGWKTGRGRPGRHGHWGPLDVRAPQIICALGVAFGGRERSLRVEGYIWEFSWERKEAVNKKMTYDLGEKKPRFKLDNQGRRGEQAGQEQTCMD